MKISTFPEDWAIKKQQSSWIDQYARKAFLKLLEGIKRGHLVVDDPNGSYEFGDPNSELRGSIIVTHPSFYRVVLFSGSIGAGEAYMSGCWQTPNLVKIIEIYCQNMEKLEQIESRISFLTQVFHRVKRFYLPNSVSGSKKNIGAHYDLSNQLFETFLDASMMYSSAIYRSKKDSLEQAQLNKLKALADKLDIHPNSHVIEIGSGWGGMAVFLAEKYGCKVTTTTISQEQFSHTQKLVSQRNLSHLVTVLDKDYRALTGQYDRLISIEMIEAVGHKHMPGFFRQCNKLVKPGGKMVLQAITIPEQRYDQARKDVDFIEKYIFPGGFLPSVQSIIENTGSYTQFQLHQVDDIGLDYANTLEDWRTRFTRAEKVVEKLGFDSVFKRLWEFYFCYCEGGFRGRAISAVQMTFRREC